MVRFYEVQMVLKKDEKNSLNSKTVFLFFDPINHIKNGKQKILFHFNMSVDNQSNYNTFSTEVAKKIDI